MSQGSSKPVDARSAFPWATVCGVALAAVLAFQIVQINRRIDRGHSGDFRHFYFAARALLRDASVSVAPLERPPTFTEQDERRPKALVDDGTDPYTSGTGGYLYPPLIALLYTPVARLSYAGAQRVMLLVDVGLVLAGLLLAGRAMLDRFDVPRARGVWFAVALVACLADVDKVHNELQMFQTNALQLALFALSLYWLDRRPVLAGLPLGAILNIKYLSLAMVPWLLMRRRWSTAIATLVSGVGFALLPAVVCGLPKDLHYLSVAYGGLATMVGHGSGTAGPVEQANVEDITNLLSCSLTSAMARMAKFHHLPLAVGLAAAGGIAVGVVGIVLLMYRRRGVPAFAWPSASQQRAQPYRAVVGLEFVAVLMGTLMFSPQTNSRHLCLVTLLTTVAAALLLGGRPQVPRWPILVALVAMFLAFVLPPGNRYTEAHHRADLWFGIGGPCWGMLIALLVVVDNALLHARLLVEPRAESAPPPHGFPVITG